MILLPKHFKVHEGFYPHFTTSVITDWIGIFCRDDYFRVLADSLAFCAEHKGLLVHGYVLMPNHFHLLSTQEEGQLSCVMRDMKGFTSRKIADKLREDGKHAWLETMTTKLSAGERVTVWQEEFHPEQVYSQPFFQQKLDYIHNNPLKAGFVEDISDWKYSSAGFYYREKPSIIPITPILW